jgi:hypothetical protein
MTEDIRIDPKLIARCGLYCGACGKFQRRLCPGCEQNSKANWCKLRSCCNDAGYGSCADCKLMEDPRACPKFNNLIAKVFGLIFNSDRAACIVKLKQLGPAEYAVFMASHRLQSLPRRGPKPV